ncbi:MAG: hypothetical protein K8I00_00780 [Candidatus Omnitrophica bacterium]|nr:hypothetical protein [Candidatus Omnitrophota bacterium]
MRVMLISSLARLIAAVRINGVQPTVHCKRIYYRKRRYWYSPFVVWGANVVLRALGIKARFLPLSRWTHRERDVYRFLYEEDVFIGPDDSVYAPARSGVCLVEYITNSKRSNAEKRAAVSAAAAALWRLHMNVLPHVGRTDMLSHGDATVLNVIYDPVVDSAQWIDFETMHAPYVNALDRQADDLHTFLFSVLSHTAEEEFVSRLEGIRQNYTDDETWLAIVAALERERWTMIYHMARARVDWERYQAIKGKLLEHLSRMKSRTESAAETVAFKKEVDDE